LGEGNYEYAVRCYDKIVLLLKEMATAATSKETLEQLRTKIAKYEALRAQAEAKNRQR
jgi:hypothetical protein